MIIFAALQKMSPLKCDDNYANIVTNIKTLNNGIALDDNVIYIYRQK